MQDLSNPYISLYSRQAISISQSLSNAEARHIASQAALMHQALGFVIKDLIRVVALKYADEDESSESMVLERLEPSRPKEIRLNEILDDKDNFEAANMEIDNYARKPVLNSNVINLDEDEQVQKIVVEGQALNFNRYAYNRKKMSNSLKGRDTLKCEGCSKLADTVEYLGQKLCSKCRPTVMEV